MLKVIDWKAKGNLVRFFLGTNNDYYGDDWDDRPYEINAGPVYDEFKEGHIDICFPFDYTVLEPQDDFRYKYGSPWSKDEFKTRACPIIVAIKETQEYTQWENCFTELIGADNDKVIKIYMNDDLDKLIKIHALVEDSYGTEVIYKEH